MLFDPPSAPSIDRKRPITTALFFVYSDKIEETFIGTSIKLVLSTDENIKGFDVMALSKNLVVIGVFVLALADGASAFAAAHHGGFGLCNTHHHCAVGKGTTLPDCKGPHKGPNGVWIQCK